MKTIIFNFITILLVFTLIRCSNKKPNITTETSEINKVSTELTKIKTINEELPIIGLLVYEGFLTMELTAPLNVFGKFSAEGNQVFNVVTVGEKSQVYISEEGLQVTPDFTFEDSPKLDVLIVPSAMDMESAIKNENILNFIRHQNKTTQYTSSNCAGAFLLGASGIADGKKIVTYVTGGELLKETYPKLLVQDDAVVSYMEDGKIISSNGNFSSYISAFELVEKISTGEHRHFVEQYLYLDRLKNWRNNPAN